MTELLYDLLGFLYWAAIIGGLLWWVMAIRRARRPRARAPRDEVELAGLRAAIEQDRRATAARPGR